MMDTVEGEKSESNTDLRNRLMNHANKIFSPEAASELDKLLGDFDLLFTEAPAPPDNKAPDNVWVGKWKSLSQKISDVTPEIKLLQHIQTKISEALMNAKADGDMRTDMEEASKDLEKKVEEKCKEFLRLHETLLKDTDKYLKECAEHCDRLSKIVRGLIEGIQPAGTTSVEDREQNREQKDFLKSCEELDKELKHIWERLGKTKDDLVNSTIYHYYKTNFMHKAETNTTDPAVVENCPVCFRPLSYAPDFTFRDNKTTSMCITCDKTENMNR